MMQVENEDSFGDSLAYFHKRNEVHWLRKIWHVATGLSGLILYLRTQILTQTETAYLLLIAAGVGFLVDFTRIRFSGFNQVVLKVLAPFMRKSEINSYSGLPFYALGVGLSFYLYEEKIAILSILFLIFADPISSYFGIRYGEDKLIPNKSVQGSVAGFCVCYLITLIYGFAFNVTDISLIFFSMFAGFVGSFSELLSYFIDDNLTIPVVSGAGLTFLNIIFQVF